MLLFAVQIVLLALWFTVLPTLPWPIVFLPALASAVWLVFKIAALVRTIMADTRNGTYTPFFK